LLVLVAIQQISFGKIRSEYPYQPERLRQQMFPSPIAAKGCGGEYFPHHLPKTPQNTLLSFAKWSSNAGLLFMGAILLAYITV
jgi:hypothetical protein